jgi:hypothetical protein
LITPAATALADVSGPFLLEALFADKVRTLFFEIESFPRVVLTTNLLFRLLEGIVVNELENNH